MAPSPTAHTSLGPLPQMPLKMVVVPLASEAHARPLQCPMEPRHPTARTSLLAGPQMALRGIVPLAIRGHTLPSQCPMAPLPSAVAPANQTSRGPLPHTPESDAACAALPSHQPP